VTNSPATGSPTPNADLVPPLRDGQAECIVRGLGPVLFFPNMRERIDARVFQACQVCQIRPLCLKAAMRIERFEPYRFGIWGGLTPMQRTNLARGHQVNTLVSINKRNERKVAPDPVIAAAR